MNGRAELDFFEKIETAKIIADKTGYDLKSEELLSQVFRHASCACESGLRSYEMLEFIGDQVLAYYVVKTVTARSASRTHSGEFACRIRENKFTQIRQSLVNNDTLAEIMDEWGAAQYLLVGSFDDKETVLADNKVRADLLEAVIGAIAVETEWDAAVLETAVTKALKLDEKLDVMIESETITRWFDMDNSVTVLKELADARRCAMPEYEYDNLGIDSQGHFHWICRVSITTHKVEMVKSVYAGSKKDAKRAAAYLLLCEYFGTQNRYGPDGWGIDWVYEDGKLIPEE